MPDKNIDEGVLWLAAFILFAVGGAAAHFSDEFFLAYPLDTWRMDLDDLIGNLGTFFVGVAALWGLRRVAKRVEQNGTKEHQLEKREESDYQRLRSQIAAQQRELDELRKELEECHGET